MIKTYRDMRMLATFSAPLRTAAFEGTDHLVVPTIALMEGVVFAGGAEGPELVPYEVLALAPVQWNGRVITWDHPVMDGQRVSANDPRVLERYAIGTAFNAKLDPEQRSLTLESWMDPRRYARNEEGKAVIRRAQTQKPIEVSVGVYIVARKEEGTFKGKPYVAVWEEITSDHVAFLPEGTIGACSNEMGCGAPRRATAVYLASATGPQLISGSEAVIDDKKPGLRDRILQALNIRGAAAGDQISAADIRRAIETELHGIEPGFLGVGEDGMFLEDKQVVYAVATDPAGPTTFYRRSFAVGKKGIEIGTERMEVAPVTRFEEVGEGRAASEPVKRTACGCGGKAGATEPAAASTNNEGDRDMKTIKERAAAIVASNKTPFKTADVAYLETLTEQRLTEIEATIPAEAVVVQPPPAASLTAEQIAKLVTDNVNAALATDRAARAAMTAEQREAELPEDVRALVAGDRAAKTARRTVLSAALKAKGSKLSDADMSGLTLEQLEEVGRMAGVQSPQLVGNANYALNGGGRGASDGDTSVPAAPSISERFAARGKK